MSAHIEKFEHSLLVNSDEVLNVHDLMTASVTRQDAIDLIELFADAQSVKAERDRLKAINVGHLDLLKAIANSGRYDLAGFKEWAVAMAEIRIAKAEGKA